MTQMGRRSFVVTVVVALLFVTLSVGRAEAQTFRNCAAVRAKYPNGVAINFAVVGTSGAYIDRRIYLQHQRLDRDKDGIICEDESKQTAMTTTQTAIPASPATDATTTTAREPITTRVPITIPTITIPPRVPITIPPREPITLPTRVPRTIPPREPIVVPPSAALCRIIRPTPAGCDSVSTTSTTTSTTTTVYQLTFTPLGQPVTTSSGLVITVSDIQQSDPGAQWNFFYLEFQVTATYPANSPNTLSHLSLGNFYLGCDSHPRSTWDFKLQSRRSLAPLASDEIAGRVRKGTTQQIRVGMSLSTADEVRGTKIDWSNHRYLAYMDSGGACPGNFQGPIFKLPFVLNPKS